jgi:hypothetical protein
MDLKINEVTIGASLSTGTSPPTEEYSAFNETTKCQNWGLNSGGWGWHCPPNHPITCWFTCGRLDLVLAKRYFYLFFVIYYRIHSSLFSSGGSPGGDVTGGRGSSVIGGRVARAP